MDFLKKHKWPLLVLVIAVIYVVVDTGSVGKDFYAGELYYDDAVYEESARSYAMTADGKGGAGSVLVDSESKVITSGSLSLHMDDVRSAVDEVTALVAGWGGFVQSSNVNRYSGEYEASMTLRVPEDQFDAAVAALKDLSLYVDSEYVYANDVTATYYDIEARLEAYQAEEQQYLAIMDRAESVTEVLEVTEALSRVRANIESTQSQLDYYDRQVGYSTLSLYLTEDARVSGSAEKWRPVSVVKQAFSDWVVFLQELVNGVLYVVIYAWPLALLWVGWRLWKRRK